MMWHRFAEILARSLKNQNEQEKLLQETSGIFLSGCIPAELSRELCKTFLGRFCQVIFKELLLSSSPNSSLSPSPNIVFNKAVVRSHCWRPLVLQSHFSSGCLWPRWLLSFILPENLHTRCAKSLYRFPAQKSLLVPWKVAVCSQLSQGSWVLKANQEKADWIHKQNWFIARRFVTWSHQHSNMPQEYWCIPYILPHRGLFKANTHMSPQGKTYRFCVKQNWGTV